MLAAVDADFLAGRPHRRKRTVVEPSDRGTIAAGHLLRRLPTPPRIARVGRDALRALRIFVVAADHHHIFSSARHRKCAGAGIPAHDRQRRHRPRAPQVWRMKQPRRRATGHEINIVAKDRETSSTGRESALILQRRRHRILWQGIPIFTVIRGHQQKFPVHWIAQRKTPRRPVANQRIKKKRAARIRELLHPTLAAVHRLVNSGFITAAARHHVRDLVVKRLNAAKIQRFTTAHRKPGPLTRRVRRT